MDLDPYPWVVYTPTLYGRWSERERLADPGWTSFWDEESERIEFKPRPEYKQEREAYV